MHYFDSDAAHNLQSNITKVIKWMKWGKVNNICWQKAVKRKHEGTENE